MLDISVVILAAGRGTRMPANKPKPLQEILGISMLSHVYRAALGITSEVWTVVGHDADKVGKAVLDEFGQDALTKCVLQEQQLGTGHAVNSAMDAMKSTGLLSKKILVLNADTPLLTTAILQDFITKAQAATVAFMSIELESPSAYGRVLRSNFRANVLQIPSMDASVNSGDVDAIMEAKDFQKEFPLCEIYEVNAGIYLFDSQCLLKLLPKISNENVNGEYYLTDIIALAKNEKLPLDAILCPDSKALLGVNTPTELLAVERHMQKLEMKRRLIEGVIIHQSSSVRISPQAVIASGVEITGPSEIYGNSNIAKNTVIESHTIIKNSTLGENCFLRSFSHMEDSSVANNVIIGPYARLRPETQLADDVRIGNFVEIKKSTIQKGSKVNHLSYIGDSELGERVNVGAGCITCNYDGVNKHSTIIGNDSFLGSDCSFIAPVQIGENVLVGAGSVITKNVPDNTIAVTRAIQKNIPRK